jgi:hypothetical protein
LLDHPELKRYKSTKGDKAVSNAYQLSAISGRESQDAIDLNLSSEMAKTMMDKIVDFKVREQALDQARNEQRDQQIQQRLETFNRCSRMTAGVAFNAGNLCLSDGRVHQRVLEQNRARTERELAASNKRKEEQDKMQRKVDAIKQKSTDPTKWNASELQTMVSWFKRPGDSKLPQCKEQLLQRYLLTCNRSEQERNRLKEGEDPVMDDAAAAAGGNTEVLAAMGNNDGDEGGVVPVVEALLQIGTAV